MPRKSRKKHNYDENSTKECPECEKTFTLGDSPGARNAWHSRVFCSVKCQRRKRDRKRSRRKRSPTLAPLPPLRIPEGEHVTLKTALVQTVRLHPELGEFLMSENLGVDAAGPAFRSTIK